jgi:hypothetical protein
MKHFKLLAIAAVSLISFSNVHAADLKSARIVEQAVSCELPAGKFDSVSLALKKLGARYKGDGVYALPEPITVFGQQVTNVAIDDQDVETYIANIPGGDIKLIAKSASLSLLAGDYQRDGKHGQLRAAIRDKNIVAISCVVSK